MIRRLGSAYLWFSPLAAVVVLFGLYHGVNLWAGIAGGILHLSLVLLGMHANGAFQRGEKSGVMLGPALLVIGGAVVWATGPSGPPTATNLTLTAYNNSGLTIGFLITLLGFAAIVPVLPSTRDRALGSVGLVCYALMFIIWLLESTLGWVLYSSAVTAVTGSPRPEWFQALGNLGRSLAWKGPPGGYLAGAAFAEVAIHAGWVRRRAGRLMSIYCAVGVLASPLPWIFLPSTATSRLEVPKAVMLAFPYLPPAMMCLVPYYIGVLGLRNPAKVNG